MNLLTINNMYKMHTDKELFSNANFSLESGEKVGVIGINGTGKSTFLRILSGELEMDAGEMTMGNQVVVRYLSQMPSFQEGITIYDHVIGNNKGKEEAWDLEGEAKTILNQLGFSAYDTKIDHLSGGEKKRVALAAALLTSCDVLVLDEPTNHLDGEMAEWLEQYLKKRKGALVMVTHDRYFLNQVCNRIIEIDKGNLYNYKGNYEAFLEAKALRESVEEAAFRKRNSILRVELEWIQRGARARSTKQKARIERFEDLKSQTGPVANEQVMIESLGSRLGKKTIELHGVGKSYDGRTLFSDFTYIFLKGDRIGIVGHNGSGKSTLLNIITGNETPDCGYVETGETVKIGYFSQENEYMDQNLRVIDYIKETAEYIETQDGKLTASKMLERFLFDGTMQYQVIEKLSGGEKRRLYLLKILMESPNVLILDEPTNDLDIATLNILEEYLDGFAGIVITVSHDRYFLDRTTKRIFAFEKEGITQYEGNYTDYQQASMEKGTYWHHRKDSFEETKEVVKEKTVKQKTKKIKFSYKEEQEYNIIEQEVESLEEKVEELEVAIMKAATDFVKLRALTEEKEGVEKALEEKIKRWVYLQELAEMIENS